MAAPTYVRQHSASWSGSGNGVVTLTTNPTVGNLLVVCYGCGIDPYTNSAAPSVTDNQGNTVTQRAYGQQTRSSYSVQAGIWTIPVVTSSGTHTVTINPAGSSANTYGGASVVEVSGGDSSSFDLANYSTQNGTSAITASLGARTNAEDFVIGVMTIYESDLTITPGSGWTQIVELDESNNTNQALNVIYQAFTSTGTNNPSWTTSANCYATSAGIAIKAAAAPAATSLVIPRPTAHYLMR